MKYYKTYPMLVIMEIASRAMVVGTQISHTEKVHVTEYSRSITDIHILQIVINFLCK